MLYFLTAECPDNIYTKQWQTLLSEFHKIIFLNKLKIVENTIKKKNKKNKTSMAKAMGPSQGSSWISGPWTDVPAEPPSHRAW